MPVIVKVSKPLAASWILSGFGVAVKAPPARVWQSEQLPPRVGYATERLELAANTIAVRATSEIRDEVVDIGMTFQWMLLETKIVRLLVAVLGTVAWAHIRPSNKKGSAATNVIAADPLDSMR